MLAWSASIADQTLGSVDGQALELWDCPPEDQEGRAVHDQRVASVLPHEVRERGLGGLGGQAAGQHEGCDERDGVRGGANGLVIMGDHLSRECSADGRLSLLRLERLEVAADGVALGRDLERAPRRPIASARSCGAHWWRGQRLAASTVSAFASRGSRDDGPARRLRRLRRPTLHELEPRHLDEGHRRVGLVVEHLLQRGPGLGEAARVAQRPRELQLEGRVLRELLRQDLPLRRRGGGVADALLDRGVALAHRPVRPPAGEGLLVLRDGRVDRAGVAAGPQQRRSRRRTASRARRGRAGS